MKLILRSLWLSILAYAINNVIPVYSMQMLGRKPLAPTTRPKITKEKKVTLPTVPAVPQPTPPGVLKPIPQPPRPALQPTAIPSIAEITPIAAPITKKIKEEELSDNQKALKDLAQDFNGKFKNALYPDVKKSLDTIIAGIEIIESASEAGMPTPPISAQQPIISQDVQTKMVALDKKLNSLQTLIQKSPPDEQKILQEAFDEIDLIRLELEESLGELSQTDINNIIKKIENDLALLRNEIVQRQSARRR